MGDQSPLEESDEAEMKVSVQSAPRPLPDAIQKMSRSETVCRYCGVSYLIFNEFHKLNIRIAQLEADLQEAKESALKEKAEREALELGKEEFEKTLQRNANEKEKLIRDDFEDKSRQLQQETTKELEKERQKMEEAFQKISNKKVEHLRRELEETESHKLSKQRAELEARTVEREKVLNDALQKTNKRLDELGEYGQQLEKRLAEATAVKEEMEKMLEDEKKQCANLRSLCTQQKQALRTCLSTLRSFGSGLTDVRGFLSQLAGAWQTFSCQLQQKSAQVLSVLREDLAHSDLEFQKVTSEKERLALQLIDQVRQSEEQLSRHKDTEKDYKSKLLRLKSELEKTHESWLSSQQRCDILQQQLSTWQQRQELMSGKCSAAEEEVRRLGEALQRVQRETKNLYIERDTLTETHNRALNKMKDDHQNELALKVCEALEKQKLEYESYLQQKMEEVQRDMDLELNIDREKNRRLLLEYQRDTARLQQKLEEQEQWVEKLQAELEKVRRSEEDQRRTYEEHMHQEMNMWKQHLDQTTAELHHMTDTNTQLQQEVAFLEETVRRECEEREELTVALSRAQEQLQSLRHSPGSNHTSNPASGPKEHLRVPLTRSSTPPNTLRGSLDKSTGQGTDPRPTGRSSDRKGSLPKIKDEGVNRKISLVMKLNDMNMNK